MPALYWRAIFESLVPIFRRLGPELRTGGPRLSRFCRTRGIPRAPFDGGLGSRAEG